MRTSHCYTLLLLVICVIFLHSCASSHQSLQDKQLQMQIVNEKLQKWKLKAPQIACDGCDFSMQQSIQYYKSQANRYEIGNISSESGLKVYIFEKSTINDSFVKLLNSNIFSDRIYKIFKYELIDSILHQNNNFAQQYQVNQIHFSTFASLSYDKRRKDAFSGETALLNSVYIVQKNNDEKRFSDSLEAYSIGDKIIILHFYNQSYSWSR